MKRILALAAAVFFIWQADLYAREGNSPSMSMKEVTVFFDSNGALKPEIRRILQEKYMEFEIRYVVEEIIKGTETYTRTIPKTARLKRVFIDKLKTVYLDFNEDFAKDHPSGTEAEIITLTSICRSIFANFDINAVQIVVDGKKLETLAGHIDIESPLTRSQIQMWLQPTGP